MADDFSEAWLDTMGRIGRPRFFAMILDRAGVSLDRALFPLLVHVEVRGPIGVMELAEIVDLNHSTVSRELAKLEALGLITREPARHDQRIRVASVTAEGRAMVAAINEARRRLLDDVFADWNDDERREFGRHFRRFADTMLSLVETGTPPPAGPPG